MVNDQYAVKDSFISKAEQIVSGDLDRSENPYIVVAEHTPSILQDIAGAKDLPLLIGYEKLYLALRESGTVKGHYHNLGVSFAKKVLNSLNDPEEIIRTSDTRINEIIKMQNDRGENVLVSVEFDAPKELGGSYDAYNVVVTLFGTDNQYVSNVEANNTVLYKKSQSSESQVNPGLYNYPGIINELNSGSNNSIPNDGENVNISSENQHYSINPENSTAGQKENTADSGVEGDTQYSFQGYNSETGKGMYKSNFPLGTPKKAKGARILHFIQNVWSKKPITLRVKNKDGNYKTIEANFDHTYSENKNVRTDAAKLMGGNRHGSAAEQRVTLDLADDYYQIASDAKYNYSKDETGKNADTHTDVKTWHYFINDILFQEYEGDEYKPYRVTVNIKEKSNGSFVYSFNAERQELSSGNNVETKETSKKEGDSTRRTLHADVNDGAKPDIANTMPSNTTVAQKVPGVNSQDMQNSRNDAETDGEVWNSINPEDVSLVENSFNSRGKTKYWIPKLSQKQWDLLNKELYRQIGTRQNYIDDITKWLYAKEKGAEVFAVYGIGDGTEPTILYAVGGKKCQLAYEKTQRFLRGYENEANQSRAALDRIFTTLQNKQRGATDGISGPGGREYDAENVRLFTKQREGNSTGNTDTSEENSERELTDFDNRNALVGENVNISSENQHYSINPENSTAGQKENTADSGVEYSIEKDSNGEDVVVVNTDQGIFLGVDKSEYSKVARQYFNGHFKGAVLSLGNEGDAVSMSKKLPGEYAYPHTALDNKSPEYSAKMKAITELGNLLKCAKSHTYSKDTKGNPEATLGWDYYEVEFLCNGRQVSGLINIANSECGRVFYDITKIKVAPAISEKYIALLARSNSTSREPSNTKIAQNAPGVNSQDMQNTQNDAETDGEVWNPINPEDVVGYKENTADRINGLERPKPNEGYAIKNGVSNDSIINPQEVVKETHSTNSWADVSRDTVIAENSTTGQKENTAGDGVEYSIEKDENGQYVKVDTDQNLFENKTNTEMQVIARNIIKSRFKGKTLQVGESGNGYVNKRSAEEYTHPANRRMKDDIKQIKMRASTELDNLLAVSKFIENQPDDGRHPDATGGWDTYSTRFEIAGEWFNGKVKIKRRIQIMCFMM